MMRDLPIKLPFQLTDARRSGLRAILSLLDLPPHPTTVDVGAGGFVGDTTTQPILDILGGKVICIEADPSYSLALGWKFGDRITNIPGYYGAIGVNAPHDLVVLDIHTNFVPQIFDELLDFAVEDGLKPGGFLISVIVYNPSVAYHEETGLLNAGNRAAQEAFLRRYFGTELLDASILAGKFAAHKEFEFVALVDKYMGEGRNCVGWVVLRRRLPKFDRPRASPDRLLRLLGRHGAAPPWRKAPWFNRRKLESTPGPRSDSAGEAALPTDSAIKIPVELTAARRSGFRAILSLLRLPPHPTVIDVGAGANGGGITTDHLVEMVNGRIIGVHPSAEVCDALREKYRDRIEAVQATYGERGIETKFDLIVMDLRPFMGTFEHLLDFALADGLQPSGFVVGVVLLDVAGAYEREIPLFPEGERALDSEFNLRFFGSERIDAKVIARKFEHHPSLELVLVIERWIGDGCLAWVVLRRKTDGRPERSALLRNPLDLTDTRRLGLRAILSMFEFPANPTSLAIVVETRRQEVITPIEEIIGGKVICVEGERLLQEHGTRLQRLTARFLRPRKRTAPKTLHDLVVINLPARIGKIYEELIDHAAEDGLKPGGYLISIIVYDPAIAHGGLGRIAATGERSGQEAFLRRHFGSERVDASTLARKFASHPQLEFIALVDEWIGGVGWVVLRRRTLPAE
ncbi:MAG: hypothetical protein ACHQAY_23820 [Hyphomicrobiales bacterium]